MPHVHDTWYLLVDGTHADPNAVCEDDNGVLRHANGTAVALRENGLPHTVGIDAKDNKNIEAANAAANKDMKPEGPRRGYKTRESKAG